MKTVNLSDQEIKELIEDGIRFRSLVEFERTVATNKWLIQILWSEGTGRNKQTHCESEYFSVEELANSDAVKVLHKTKLEALRTAVDKANGDYNDN